MIRVAKLHVESHAVVVQEANAAFWVQRAGRSHRTALEEPSAMATTWVRGGRSPHPQHGQQVHVEGGGSQSAAVTLLMMTFV